MYAPPRTSTSNCWKRWALFIYIYRLTSLFCISFLSFNSGYNPNGWMDRWMNIAYIQWRRLGVTAPPRTSTSNFWMRWAWYSYNTDGYIQRGLEHTRTGNWSESVVNPGIYTYICNTSICMYLYLCAYTYPRPTAGCGERYVYTQTAIGSPCAVAPRWGRRPQRHSGGGGPAPKAATRVAASIPPPSI